MRFPMARSKVWQPLLSLFGATASRSYVSLDDAALEAHLGLFTQRVRLSEIDQASIAADRWRWYFSGIGWRTNFVRAVAFVSAARNAVCIKLKEPRWVRVAGLPARMSELYVTLEEPRDFLTALKAAGVRVSEA